MKKLKKGDIFHFLPAAVNRYRVIQPYEETYRAGESYWIREPERSVVMKRASESRRAMFIRSIKVMTEGSNYHIRHRLGHKFLGDGDSNLPDSSRGLKELWEVYHFESKQTIYVDPEDGC